MTTKAVNTVPKDRGLPLKSQVCQVLANMNESSKNKPHIWTSLFRWSISVVNGVKDTTLPHFFNVVIKHIRKRRILLVAECKRLEIILSWGCNHFA